MSFYNLITNKLYSWLQELAALLPNLLLAVLVLIIGFFVAGYVKKIASKLSIKLSGNTTINTLFISAVHISFIGILLFTALNILGLDKTVTSILAGAGIIGLALAFAFQDMAANFVSGIFMSIRKPLHIGDIVQIKNYMGKVEEINLRDTVIRTFQGQMVIMPNKDVFQNPIENFTLLGKRRIDLKIGISYSEDLEKVRSVTLAAVEGIADLSKDDDITFFYQEFGDSAINFVIRLWIRSPEQPIYWSVTSEAIIRIKKAYNENNIVIPFPIRTLDFDLKSLKQ